MENIVFPDGIDINTIIAKPIMTPDEAKIILLLTPRSGKYIFPQQTHNAIGIAGYLNQRPSTLYNILKGMVAKGYLTELPRKVGRGYYFAIKSQEVVNEAAELTGTVVSPEILKCEACGCSYSKEIGHCPECAKKEVELEANYILDANTKEENALVVRDDNITLPACPGVDLTGAKVAEFKGQVAEGEWHRTHATSGDLNVISRLNKEKVQKDHKKFAEWCNNQNLSDMERFSLHILINQDGSFIDSIYWKVRAKSLIENNLSETEKVFKTHVGKRHMIAQVLDCVKRIAKDYGEGKK